MGKTNPKFKIRCGDDDYEFVDIKCVYESKYILNSLLDMDYCIKINNREVSNCKYIDDRDIGFFSINSRDYIPRDIVKMVEYYCVSRYDIISSYGRADKLLLDKLEDLNHAFLQNKPLPILAQLQNAAINLKIKSLLNLTRNAIVDMLDGMSADEIRNIFNMPDFKHDAWKNLFVQESWTTEQMSYQTNPKLLAAADQAVPNAEVIHVSDSSTYDSATNTSAYDLNGGPEVCNPDNNEVSESGLEEEVLDEPASVQSNSTETGPVKKYALQITAPSITIGNPRVVAETTRVGGGVGGGREWYSFRRGGGFRGRGGYRGGGGGRGRYSSGRGAYCGCLINPNKSALLFGGGGGRGHYSSGRGAYCGYCGCLTSPYKSALLYGGGGFRSDEEGFKASFPTVQRVPDEDAQADASGPSASSKRITLAQQFEDPHS